MIKVLVKWPTYCKHDVVREYESLEDCVTTLLDTEDFGDWFPKGIIISRLDEYGEDDYGEDEMPSGCEWVALVYNSYIE